MTAEIPVANQKTRGSGGDDLLNEFNMFLEGGLSLLPIAKGCNPERQNVSEVRQQLQFSLAKDAASGA